MTQPTDNGAGNVKNSLSWAINQANAKPGSEIDFNINNNTLGTKKTIAVTGQEPTITQPTTINGFSQSGLANGTTPWIELDGPGAEGNQFDGLTATSGQVVIEGLAIDGFNGNGIVLNDPNAGIGEGDIVRGCNIGTSLEDQEGSPNVLNGILIQGANNTIGGVLLTADNNISGNGSNGIEMDGASAVLNVVEGNYIGLDNIDVSAIPNGANGVWIHDGASDNTVGGFNNPTTVGNVISGNTGAGVRISDPNSTGNSV